MIFLVGFMGSGKTSVGRRVAERRGWKFLDTDALAEQREGRTIEEIFADSGEAHFRRLEWEILRSLEARSQTVVATGGGLFQSATNRRFMGQIGTSVWLDSSLEECSRRVAPATGRPLWTDRDPARLRALFEKRRAAYALARVRIAPVGPPERVAEDLLERLRPFFR